MSEIKTGADLIQELGTKGPMNISHGMLSMPDEYELVYSASDAELTEKSPMFTTAISIIDDLASEGLTDGIVISRLDFNNNIIKIEAWKNLSRTRNPDND